MTTAPTTETRPRHRAGHALAAAVVVAGLGLVVGGPAGAGLGEPVDPRDPADETTTSTTAPATTAAPAPSTGDSTPDAPPDDDATTVPAASADAGSTDGDADDGGTSAAALGAVGLVAFVVGLLVAAVPLGIALSRRKASPRPVPPPPPVPVAPATPAPVPAGGIAIGPAPSRDADAVRQQRASLAEALIVLRDQLPSEALRAQAADALAAAGYAELDPVGEPFDPARHRAVHQVATDDPAQHDRIVAVERPGYADGGTVVRQPEVVVGRHGGGS